MFRRVICSGHLYLWLIWFALLSIYVTTILKTGQYGNALVVFFFLLILYFAEGMEIAAATLADKQAAQIDSSKASNALELIKRDTEWFFAQRQVFVVTIVTFTSLMTTFSAIYVPFYQSVLGPDFRLSMGSTSIPLDVPFWFTLIFTSFTILWWCQVFPKRLALRNSVAFLHQSSVLMWPIRGIGRLNLPGPADQLVWLAAKLPSYKVPSSLKPSRGSYYDTGVMLYGYAVDRVSTQLEIRQDGSTRVTQRTLLIFIHGGRTAAKGTASSDSAFVTLPQIGINSIHSCLVPEKLELIWPQLDDIFEGKSPRPGHEFESHPPAETLHPHLTFDPPAPGPNETKIAWTIDWEMPLPRGLRRADRRRILVALVHEATLEFGPGAYAKKDYYTWTGELPCRRFTLEVRPAANNNTSFGIERCIAMTGRSGAPFRDESTRMERVIDNAPVSGKLDVDYPMQGITYRVEWTGWNTNSISSQPAQSPVP